MKSLQGQTAAQFSASTRRFGAAAPVDAPVIHDKKIQQMVDVFTNRIDLQTRAFEAKVTDTIDSVVCDVGVVLAGRNCNMFRYFLCTYFWFVYVFPCLLVRIRAKSWHVARILARRRVISLALRARCLCRLRAALAAKPARFAHAFA
jgi:hypothetical protein